jgi:hypothetical protein
MDAVTLILIVLAAFNLSLLVMNTQNPLRRFWVQVILMFLIMMLFNVADEMFVGFLVFVRLIVYCMGYKRAKQQLAQATFQLP